MTPLAPLQARALEAFLKYLLIAVLLAFVFCAGWAVQGARKDVVIGDIRLEAERLVSVANKAALAAEGRASLAESTERKAFATALSKYKETTSHEKSQADLVIADLRSDVKRLRVSTNPGARRCPVPGSTAAATGSDGPSEETLSPAVAARLAGRYADYNALVDTLTLCQAVIQGRQSTAPPAQ